MAGQAGAWMVGVRLGGRVPADAAVLVGLGNFAHGPADDQKERHDRDLQQDHQPYEGPSIHGSLLMILPDAEREQR